MKILQVVTLASRSGAYGGPMSVAESQSAALRRRGHAVCLAAGVRLGDAPTTQAEGCKYVRVRRVLPMPGFAGYWSLAALRALRREVRESTIVHVQFARDLFPLTACVLAIVYGRPLYLQTHGMIQPTAAIGRRVFDWMLIRPILRRASVCLVYTDEERKSLELVARSRLPSREVLNGAEPPPAGASVPSLEDYPLRVLFAARLHPRKRVGVLLTAIDALPPELRKRLRLTIAGPDEGELGVVQTWLATTDIQAIYIGGIPVGELRAELSYSHLLVQPSVNEPFSVTLLDAQARGCPVIVSDTNGYASYCEAAEAGLIFKSDDCDDLARVVVEALSDKVKYRMMRLNAARLIHERFSWDEVAQFLDEVYVATTE